MEEYHSCDLSLCECMPQIGSTRINLWCGSTQIQSVITSLETLVVSILRNLIFFIREQISCDWD